MEPVHWERQVTGDVWRAGSRPGPLSSAAAGSPRKTIFPGTAGVGRALAVTAVLMSTCDGNGVKSILTGSHPADLLCKKTLELTLSLWDPEWNVRILLCQWIGGTTSPHSAFCLQLAGGVE